MASVVELCNLALANIHAKGINSINESSAEAQYCKLKYNFVLDFMLREAQWNFAHKQEALALVTDSLFTWVYAYQYPSDCLKINYMISDIDQMAASSEGFAIRPDYYYDDYPIDDYQSRRIKVPFEVVTVSGNKLIGCNEPDLWLDYQVRELDPNKYDSQFTMAFVWYLAAEIAIPIVGGATGREMRSDALKMYQALLAEAMASDANEQYNGQQRESDFILVRG